VTHHVVIGVPSGDRITTDTKTALTLLMHHSRDILYKGVDVKGTYLSHTHNDLVRTCLYEPGVTKLLFVDSDMDFPQDALERLDKHDLDIVGCTYKKRGGRRVRDEQGRVVRVEHDMMINRLRDREYPREPQPLEEWAKLPSGFLLVKMKVFRKIRWPWFFETYGPTPDDFTGTDYNFCFKARAHGFGVWCDLDLSSWVMHLSGDEPLLFEWPAEGPEPTPRLWGDDNWQTACQGAK
jgi:hypothetical protein